MASLPKISAEALERLKSLAKRSGLPVSEVLQRLVDHAEEDEFLIAPQREKMQELWDNEQDAIWDTI